jgi:nucleoid-associated protein YgaU
MPWTSKSAKGHTKKASSGILQRQWSDVANSMLKAGKSEASAIKGANSVVARRRSAEGKAAKARKKK